MTDDIDPKIISLAELQERGRPRDIALVPFSEITISNNRSYLIKGVIPDIGLAVIWGEPKCGKSFLTSDMAFHVALGWPWRGRRVKPGPVVYLAAEGAHGFRARVAAFRQEKLSETDTRVPFFLVPTPLDIVGDHQKLISAIRDTLGDDNPVMVVLDTLNRTLRGSENNDEDMSAYIKAADAIRDAFNCAVVIVHHCGVQGTRPRGHTSLSGAIDAQIAVKKDGQGIIAATVELMKDGQEGDTFASRLNVVDVGEDEDGDPVTSCVIEETEASATEKQTRLPARQRRALGVLHDCIIESGQPSPGGPHYPSSARVVSVSLWRECLFKAGVLDKKAANPRQDFKRIKDGLTDRGACREWNDLIWTTSHENEA